MDTEKLSTLATRFACATIVGKILNVVFAKAFPGGKTSIDRPDMIEGFPRYRWLLSVFGQAVCMQGCWICAYFVSSAKFGGFSSWSNVREWCLLSADDLAARDCIWEGLYLVVLFAAQGEARRRASLSLRGLRSHESLAACSRVAPAHQRATCCRRPRRRRRPSLHTTGR